MKSYPGGAHPYRHGGVSALIYPRGIVTLLLLLALILTLSYACLAVGKTSASPADIHAALTAPQVSGVARSVRLFRLPRLIVALLVGASLGVSGMLFQKVSRNPLGSPDIIGVSSGAVTGATVTIVFFSHSITMAPVGALVGAAIAVVTMLSLTAAKRTDSALIIFVGIGLGATFSGLTRVLLAHGESGQALLAGRWIAGRLSAVGTADIWLLAATLTVCLPAASVLLRQLQPLEGGDDFAIAAGAQPHRTRLLAMVVGVVACVAAVVTTGPIGFIALASPHLARALVGAGRDTVYGAALSGAALLVSADLFTSLLPSAWQAPVGLMTAMVGGIYFALVLTRKQVI